MNSDIQYIATNVVQEVAETVLPSAKKQKSGYQDNDEIEKIKSQLNQTNQDTLIEESSDESSIDDDSDDENLTDTIVTGLCEDEIDAVNVDEQPKTKNEIVDTVEKWTGYTIVVPRGIALIDVGNVMYRIDHEQTIVVEGNGNTETLGAGAMLCTEQGVVLGKIQDVFGPVTKPFYAVVGW